MFVLLLEMYFFGRFWYYMTKKLETHFFMGSQIWPFLDAKSSSPLCKKCWKFELTFFRWSMCLLYKTQWFLAAAWPAELEEYKKPRLVDCWRKLWPETMRSCLVSDNQFFCNTKQQLVTWFKNRQKTGSLMITAMAVNDGDGSKTSQLQETPRRTWSSAKWWEKKKS